MGIQVGVSMVGRGAWGSFPPMAPIYLVKDSVAHTNRKVKHWCPLKDSHPPGKD